jgi:hypothetical protein
VSKLDLAGDVTIRPQDHTMKFVGEMSCHAADGSPMHELVNDITAATLDVGITIQHSFSHKPAGGYVNYYEKVTTYVAILCTQAHRIDSGANPRTFRVKEPEDDSPFRYIDTASSRAEMNMRTKESEEPECESSVGSQADFVLQMPEEKPQQE